MAKDIESLFSERLIPVTKCVADYSPGEQSHFREIFRPRADDYRRYSLRASIVGLSVFIVWMAATQVFPRAGLGWVCGLMFIGVLGLVVVSWFTWPQLECPACHNAVDSKQLGLYCPTCGSKSLRPGELCLRARCGACGSGIYYGKSRGYKIRACTHCGVLLDEKNV